MKRVNKQDSEEIRNQQNVPAKSVGNKLLSGIAVIILLLAAVFTKGEGLVSDSDASDTGSGYEISSVQGFRNQNLLNEHYNKHGIEMGFSSAAAYEEAAKKVVVNSNALHKLEAEDGDDVYYIENTNEFVVVSTDGYIRTYFKPNDGKAYFDRQ